MPLKKRHVYACIYFLLLQLRGPRSNGIPVPMSTPSPQILVFNTILQQKEPGLLGKMTDSGARAGKEKKKKNNAASLRAYQRDPTEKAPNG